MQSYGPAHAAAATRMAAAVKQLRWAGIHGAAVRDVYDLWDEHSGHALMYNREKDGQRSAKRRS
eukprot:354591-Chlamydomonas_euryale.AAC.2